MSVGTDESDLDCRDTSGRVHWSRVQGNRRRFMLHRNMQVLWVALTVSGYRPADDVLTPKSNTVNHRIIEGSALRIVILDRNCTERLDFHTRIFATSGSESSGNKQYQIPLLSCRMVLVHFFPPQDRISLTFFLVHTLLLSRIGLSFSFSSRNCINLHHVL